MSESPNKLIRFWQELKRRKTGKVIVAYAATAFILLQLADILTPALLLPDWTTRLITLILIIGFPVAVIFSWVFDITPVGIMKTESTEISEDKETLKKPTRRIISATNIIISALIIVVAILAYPKIFKQDTMEKLRSSGERISVAVLPFQNMTNDTTWNVWQDGIQNELINNLTNSEELKIKQADPINSIIQGNDLKNYASITPSVARAISQRLDADLFVIGTIQKAGTTVRLNAQLIDSKTEEVLKSFQVQDIYREEKIFQLVDSLSGEIRNLLIISTLKRELSHDNQTITTTNSPEAYRYFLYGLNSFKKRDYPTARNFLHQALSIDSNFASAILYMSSSYLNQGLYDQSKIWCLKAYEKRGQMPMIQKFYINWLFAANFETPHDEIIYLREILEIDNQLYIPYFLLGNSYLELNQYDRAISGYEKALGTFKKLGIKPSWIYNYSDLGRAYHKIGKYRQEKKLYKKAKRDFPDDPILIYRQTVLALSGNKIKDANEYIEKYRTICKENAVTEETIMNQMADIYSEAGILDKAEEYYRQALSIEPEKSVTMNNLAYFLIDNDRNLNEGLELVNKVLELSPEDYNFLHTKGWGLYKQGRYREALDILQKSWDIRREKAVYDNEAFLHLEAAKKAVAGLK